MLNEQQKYATNLGTLHFLKKKKNNINAYAIVMKNTYEKYHIKW